MNASYYIRKGRLNKEGKTVLMLDITWRGYRLQCSSGELVVPKHFTPDGKKLLSTAHENSLALNWKLGQLKLNVEKEYLLASHQDGVPVEFSVEDMRALVGRLTGKQLTKQAQKYVVVPKGPETITDIYEQWKQVYKHKFSRGQLLRHSSALPWLEKYCPSFSLDLLDEQWVDAYVSWLLDTTTLGNSSIVGHIGFFRAMLKFKRLPHDWLKVSLPANEVEVDLHYEEVLQLYNHDYQNGPLRIMVDTYVLLTQIGLRYGDYLRVESLTPVRVNGETIQTIQLRQSKTKGLVTVPLTPLALEIWEKYAGNIPKPTNQYLNRMLKHAGRLANLTREVEVTTIRGKKYQTSKHPLYQLLTAHTARHTFASLLLEASGNKELAQQGLGHSSLSATGIYARPKTALQIQQTLAAWGKLQKDNAQP